MLRGLRQEDPILFSLVIVIEAQQKFIWGLTIGVEEDAVEVTFIFLLMAPYCFASLALKSSLI